MKVLAASLSSIKGRRENIKTVVLKRTKNSFVLVNAKQMSLPELLSYKKTDEVKLTFDYTDFMTTELELPPISDPKSLSFLIRSRVQDLVLGNTEYTFATSLAVVPMDTDTPPPTEQSGVPRKKYTIFGVPSDFMYGYGITHDYALKVGVSTLDPFALGCLSEKVDPVGFVCHVFADEEKIILSFSMGHEQIYSRTTYIPDDIKEADALNSFYYETINLTYLYIKQNRQAEVNTVILSGKLANNKNLIDTVEKFVNIPVTQLSPGMFIKDCDEKTFHTYLLAIGCAFATDYVSFISISDREKRVYKWVMNKLNILMLLISLGCSAVAYTKFMEYSALKNDIEIRNRALDRKLRSLDPVIASSQEYFYDNQYINLLSDRAKTPLNMLEATQGLLASENFTSIQFTGSGERSAMLVKHTQGFKSYLDTYNFSQSYLNSLKSTKGVQAQEMMKIDLKSRTYQLDAQLNPQGAN